MPLPSKTPPNPLSFIIILFCIPQVCGPLYLLTLCPASTKETAKINVKLKLYGLSLSKAVELHYSGNFSISLIFGKHFFAEFLRILGRH